MLLIFYPHKKRGAIPILSNKYINFLDLSLKTVQSGRLNLYSCKFLITLLFKSFYPESLRHYLT